MPYSGKIWRGLNPAVLAGYQSTRVDCALCQYFKKDTCMYSPDSAILGDSSLFPGRKFVSLMKV